MSQKRKQREAEEENELCKYLIWQFEAADRMRKKEAIFGVQREIE